MTTDINESQLALAGETEAEAQMPTRRAPRRRGSTAGTPSGRMRWEDRPRAARGSRAEYRPIRRVRREVWGIGLLVVGMVILFASSTNSAGVLPGFLKLLLSALVGNLGSAIVSLALMGLGIALLAGSQGLRVTASVTWLGVLFGIFLGLVQIGAPQDGFIGRHFTQEPGGLFGLLIAEALKPLLGRGWGALVLVAGALCALIQMTEVSPATILQHALRATALSGSGIGGWLSARLRRRSQLMRLEKRAAQSRSTKLPEFARPALPTRPAKSPEKEAPVAKAAPKLVPEPEHDNETVNVIPVVTPKPGSDMTNYVMPPISLLTPGPKRAKNIDNQEAIDRMEILEQTLASFGIDAKVVEIERGPRVTRYEIRSPRGVRVSRITNLADDIAYSLSALDVRVEAPVPGKGVIGIEVPNSEAVFVDLLEIISSPEAQKCRSKVSFALGKDITGNPRMADLAKMPHLLIAGATNSGKSVCLNTIIASLLFMARPDEVKMIMIDPKRVELSLFSGIPHLIAPVAHDVKEAAGLLRWALREMERRYEIFAELGVRNIAGFNERAAIDEDIDPMAYIVIIIDELADFMMQAKGEFEASICRLAQLARATGIHLIVATQRPSVNVITGTIKANIASRIAFAVASQADSRVILDMNGAERLVGSGDMLYLPIDEAKPVRIQGAYVSEKDVNRLVKHLKEQAEPQYSAEALAAEQIGSMPGADADEMADELFDKALEYVTSTKYASASMLQRKMRVGYTRAARLIDMMEDKGYIGPADGSKPREVYVTPTVGGASYDDLDE